MKSFFLLFATTASLASCTMTQYQLTAFAPPAGFTGEKPHVRQHEAVTLEYDFSGPSNRMSFQVHNRLNQDIFLDFSRSSLIINDVSIPYHHSATETNMQIQSDTYVHPVSLTTTSLSGTAQSQLMGPVVIIPSGTRVYFQRIELPVPLLPFQQDQVARGLRRVHPAVLEAKVGATYRHRLAFMPEKATNEPFFIEDAFVVKSMEQVNKEYFLAHQSRLQRPESLVSNFAVQEINHSGTIVSTVVLTGLFILALREMGDGN